MIYSKSSQLEVNRKLFYVVELLFSICDKSNSVLKLKNHPIHDYADFLHKLALDGAVTHREIEYQILEAIELKNDFLNSKNQWLKNNTALVVQLLQEIIDGNFSLPSELK